MPDKGLPDWSLTIKPCSASAPKIKPLWLSANSDQIKVPFQERPPLQGTNDINVLFPKEPEAN